MRAVIAVFTFCVMFPGSQSVALAQDSSACERIDSHLEQMRSEADPRIAEGMALPIFQKLCSDAVAGDADAQFQLAELFRKGWFAPKDQAEAFAWYEAAAEDGNPDARAIMGLSLLNGMAEFWYRKAAEAGSKEAERQLATRDQWGAPAERRELTAGEVWVTGFVALFALAIAVDVLYETEPFESTYEAPNMRAGLDAACHWMTPTERIWAECM